MTKLRYINGDEEGYTRKKWGRGFTYLDENGETITDPDLREWIESIVIPPAWTDVWISPYKNGHILATGRDDAGRKQYRYHPDWEKQRQQKKFDALHAFGECLPHIRAVTDEHLRKHKLSRKRVLAAIVRLLETTLIRIGNQQYSKENDTYGLTTLTDDHADVSTTKIEFDFVGKSNKEHQVILRDRRLARVVQQCKDIEGYHLFQYYDDEGNHHAVGSGDVNAYLKEISGQDLTAKTFRTWGGSALAIQYLCEHDAPLDDRRLDCIKQVADALGNTKAVCRDYYIHPLVIEAHMNDKLCAIYAKTKSPKSDYELSREEQTLMQLIKSNQ